MFALLLGVVGAKAENVIQVVPTTVVPGTTASSKTSCFVIHLYSDVPMSACQFEIYVPQGITFNATGFKEGAMCPTFIKEMDIPGYGTLEIPTFYHTFGFNVIEEAESARVGYNHYRITCADYNNNTLLDQTKTELLKIYYDADASMSEGVYPIYLTNIVMDNAGTGEGKIAKSVSSTTSYFTVGNPSSSAANLPLEGYVASFVMDALAADETVEKLDLSAVTGIGGTLTLKDGVELVPPTEEITIPEVTYTRSIGNDGKNKYGTICLPYKVKTNTTIQYYAVGGLENGMLSLLPLDEVEAGTPAIFEKKSEEKSITATETNVTIPVVDSHVAGADVQLIGTYTNLEVTEDGTYYIKDDKFYSKNEYFFIKAYRAYLKATSASAKVIGIGEEATGIDSLDALTSGEYDGIYAPNGVRTDKLQKGVNLIKTGDKVKKVFVK